MGKEEKLFKSKERKNRSDISAFLHQLADQISEGRVDLHQEEKEITVQLPDSLILKIQVEDKDKKTKGTRHSLELKLKWYDDEPGEVLE